MRRLALFVCIVCLATAGESLGAATWTNAYPWGSLWNVEENWDPPMVPGPDETVYINPPPEQGPVIDVDTEIGELRGPRFDSDSNQAMYIFHGAVTINGSWEFGDNGSGTSAITIYGQSDVTVGGQMRHRQGRAEVFIGDTASLLVNSDLRLADSGFAILDISGDPNIVIGGELAGGGNAGGWFEAYISGGTLSVGEDFVIGANGSGLIDISGGGVSCDGLELQLLPEGATGQLNISDGELYLGDALWLCQGSGSAVMDMNNADVNIGSLYMSGGSGNSSLNMTGGSLIVRGPFEAPVSPDGNSIISLGDGLLQCASFTHAGHYSLDISDGVMIIDGDVNDAIMADVNSGHITPAPDKNDIMVDFNNVNPGRTTVWATPHFEAMPYVVGLSRTEAQSLLSENGLAIGSVTTE